MNPTIDLSISNENLDCNEIMKLLHVSCKISPNITKICKNRNCHLENGCNITITEDANIPKIWKDIQRNCNVRCAHLNIHGKYKGCILNYLRESSCPKY